MRSKNRLMDVRRAPFFAVAALGVTPCVCAQPGAHEIGTESPWRIGLAFGYGERSNPLVQSDNLPVLVDVDVAWYGDRWFFDNGDGGRTLVDRDRFTLNAIGRFNSDRVFFSMTDTEYVEIFSFAGTMPPEPIEVPDRDYAVEAGVELLSDGEWGFAQVSASHDVSDTHGGYELDFNFGRTFRQQRWFVEPSFGLSYKSADLNNYYWGVRPEESNLALAEYEAGAGVNVRAGISACYQLTPNWRFVTALRYERLNNEAAASPLAEDGFVKSGFAGFSFRF